MAKFCTNCGAQMEEDDKVCGQCGARIEGEMDASAAGENISQAAAAVSEGKPGTSQNYKWIVAIIVAVAAIAVIITSIVLVSRSRSYNGTLRKMTKALQENDIETLESLTSSIAEAKEENGDSDYYETRVSDVLDKYEDNVGIVEDISYEITDQTEMSERRVENVKNNLSDEYHMDIRPIEDILQVNLRLIVEGERKSASYNVDNLYLIKEDGSWKVYTGELTY